MSANAAGVLPMIVGALEDKGKAPVEEAEPVEEDGSAEAADKSDETSDKDEDTPGEGDETAAAEPRESAEARP
jgi:hypothetical protein